MALKVGGDVLALLDDQPESVREGVRLGAGVKSAAVSDPGATACVSSIRSDSPCPGVGRRAPVAFSLGRNPRGGSSSASRSTSHTPFDELGGPGVGQRLRQTVAPGLVFGLQAGAARPTVPAAASSGPAGVRGRGRRRRGARGTGVAARRSSCPLVGRPGGRGVRPAAVACCFAAGWPRGAHGWKRGQPPGKKRGVFRASSG